MKKNYGIDGNNALKTNDSYLFYPDSVSAPYQSEPRTFRFFIETIVEEIRFGTARGVNAKPLSKSDRVFAGLVGFISTCVLAVCVLLPNVLS